jgi:hypothetical protein
MRIETLMDLQGAQVSLFGDFSTTIEVYKRIRANGGVMETWIGTWTNPEGVRVDLFDNVKTLRRAVEEAMIQIMYLWQDHVVLNGTEEDLNELIKFDQNVTRCLGLSDHAVSILHQKIQKRVL